MACFYSGSFYSFELYRNDPKFSDRYAWTNSARLVLEEQSDLGLHCLPFRLHRLDSLLYGRATDIVQILEWLQQMFWVSEYLGNLR